MLRYSLPAFALLIAAMAPQQPVLRAPSELPATLYPLGAPPSDAFRGDDFLRRTVPLLRTEAERVRAAMRIEDTALATDLIAGLVAIALLQDRRGDALQLIGAARASAEKPRQRAAPLVVRAAAQMLATNPRLSAAQLATGLRTTTVGGDGLKLLHAANAIAWARVH